MWEALADWLLFLVVVSHVVQFCKFLFNFLLGVAILMWLAVFKIFALMNTTVSAIFYPFGSAANYVLTVVLKPFAATATFLGCLGTLTFTVLHLALWALYYIVVLWLLICLLNLLYHFIQHRDFSIQGEFYFGPSPCRDHFG